MKVSNKSIEQAFLGTAIAGSMLCVVLTIILVTGTLSHTPQLKANATANELSQISNSQKINGLHRSLPAQLIIPKLQIAAKVDEMGITPSGLLESPAGPKTVGWYKLGPYPGETGSAVIDGHYGRWQNGEGSVFDNLNTLVPGDSVVVLDQKGEPTNFVVRSSRTFTPKEDDNIVFHSNDGKAHLNLITCDGQWSNSTKSYSLRLVVFTDKQ